MAELPELLKSIYRDGNNGKQFELFVKWFLMHDPEWKTHIDEVWLWDDWLGRWGRDKSIDLVFRHRDGDIWAVQAKCYASSIRITKEDMDTFLSESSRKVISRRLLMASADKMGANAREVCAGQEKPVTHFLLSDFEKAAIDSWLAALAKHSQLSGSRKRQNPRTPWFYFLPLIFSPKPLENGHSHPSLYWILDVFVRINLLGRRGLTLDSRF
jgi:predicted helicase